MLLSRCYFNSIKVQLELRIRTTLIVTSLFQFHKGTIRTGKEWKVTMHDT